VVASQTPVQRAGGGMLGTLRSWAAVAAASASGTRRRPAPSEAVLLVVRAADAETGALRDDVEGSSGAVYGLWRAVAAAAAVGVPVLVALLVEAVREWMRKQASRAAFCLEPG
jgi:hypothetical protein